jgi:exopolysaccharide biosynthesis protein
VDGVSAVSRVLLCIFLLVVLFCLASSGVFPSWHGIELPGFLGQGPVYHWNVIADGVEYREVRVATSPGEAGSLKMARFDQNQIKARILYARNFGAQSLTVKEMVERSGALAGINASYFDEHERPLGYLKVRGSEVNDYIASPIIYSGVFAVKNGKASIQHRDIFHPLSFDEALQCGPRLVAEGKGTTGIENTIDYKRAARRAGAAIDRKGRVIIYVTAPLSTAMNWKELRDVLLGPAEQGGIDPVDVMNLDGGSSTQIYVKGTKMTVQESSMMVPVGIGFFRK